MNTNGHCKYATYNYDMNIPAKVMPHIKSVGEIFKKFEFEK